VSKVGDKRLTLRLIREATFAYLDDEEGRDDYLAPTAVTAHPNAGYTAIDKDEITASKPMMTRRYHHRPFSEIAQELGLSISGAKKIVDQALTKAKFINKMFPSQEERNAFMLDMVDQYIDFLGSSGELDSSELDLLYDNPEHVIDLDGFQEFLMDELKDAGYRWEQGMK
jgi:hypothetical protein